MQISPPKNPEWHTVTHVIRTLIRRRKHSVGQFMRSTRRDSADGCFYSRAFRQWFVVRKQIVDFFRHTYLVVTFLPPNTALERMRVGRLFYSFIRFHGLSYSPHRSSLDR